MKKTLLSLFALSASLVGFAANPNPFAYAVSGEYDALILDVAYSLNTDADKAEVQILKNGTVVKIQEVSATAGENTAEIDLSGLADGDYTWQIAVTGGATTGNPEMHASISFYHPCGLDIDNNPENPSFGTLFVAEGYTSGKKTGYHSAQADGTEGSGLYMFTPDMNAIQNKDGGVRFYPSFLTHSHAFSTKTSAGADFSKVAVADDGRIFVSRHNNSGDYILYAESVEKLKETGEFKSLLAEKSMTDDLKIYNDANGNFLAGPTQAMDVKGSGESTKILVIARADQDVSTLKMSSNRTVEYNIGTASTITEAKAHPTLDKKYTISYDRSANVAYDNRGGIWYCQHRGTPTDTEPALVYVDADGNQQYFEGVGGKVRSKAAIAISPDGKRLAVARDFITYSSNHLAIYDIEFDNEGVVTLTETNTIDFTFTGKSDNLMSATWDIAGNIYLGNSSREWVRGFAVPRADNTFATKAASKYNFTVDTATGVETIGADNAPVEYYNLQGVKVENPENGIFIKKQGNKAVKVIL